MTKNYRHSSFSDTGSAWQKKSIDGGSHGKLSIIMIFKPIQYACMLFRHPFLVSSKFSLSEYNQLIKQSEFVLVQDCMK